MDFNELRNERENKHTLLRVNLIGGFLGVCLLIFAGLLFYTQKINGAEYLSQSVRTITRSEKVEASRGIITDRNGKVLISNRLTYTLVFSDEEFESDTDCNDAIFRLLELCRSNNVKWTDTLPVSKEPPFTYTTPTDEGAFREYLKSEDLPAITVGTLRPTQEAPLFMAQLRKLYGVADSYSDTDARAIIGVRYQLALRDIAGGTYTFASDVSVELINQVVDGRYAGVTTGTASARVYDTTYAAHVLGRGVLAGQRQRGIPGQRVFHVRSGGRERRVEGRRGVSPR